MRYLLTFVNCLLLRESYKYLLLGGHGMGLASTIFYLEKIGAKPKQIFWYEIIPPFYFYKSFDGLVFDKDVQNKVANRVISRLTLRVPCYQIIRDPISVIKSCVNASCFHRISVINTKDDMASLLIEILSKTPHLMFHFASMRNSVKHLILDVTYLTQDSIGQDNLQNTLNDFADRLGYKHIELSKSISVLKGTTFPRAFPHFFQFQNKSFVLTMEGRDNGSKEMDKDTFVEKKFKVLNKRYPCVKTIIVPGYEEFPLQILRLDYQEVGEGVLFEVEKKAREYIDYVLTSLQKHKTLILNEEEIIGLLTSPDCKDFGLKVAQKIHQECFYIRKERPDLLDTFSYSKRFLSSFGIDLNRG
ncbi:hypothetical protein [Helicobacter sp. 'house sparrow 1']|uniref:hypothetical protein n=3 Tax=unclassified Helicobacter TaxID=2593540 RepID=UPI00131590A8|nr:hypothetical protein [Helicobacter sp. 'house sparrow 1']